MLDKVKYSMLLCVCQEEPNESEKNMVMAMQISFRDLRIRAGYKIARLARDADVSPSSIYRIEDGEKVTRELVQAVLNVINDRLRAEYTVDDIEGLNF